MGLAGTGRVHSGEKSSLQLKESVHSAISPNLKRRQRDWFNLTWQTPMIV